MNVMQQVKNESHNFNHISLFITQKVQSLKVSPSILNWSGYDENSFLHNLLVYYEP